MPARLHIDPPPIGPTLAPGAELPLPPNASRHVQVLRLQPGATITLFDGQGGEWLAEVLAMGQRSVSARVLAHVPVECELDSAVTLALGMPANERMDSLVEKATELGVATIQPLVCERSVLRLAGERAERRTAHWSAVAAAACEQSGRNRVPRIAAPLLLRDWLATQGSEATGTQRLMLSLEAAAPPLAQVLADAATRAGAPDRAAPDWLARRDSITLLSGPEGGLSPAEQAAARACGFRPVTLGSRVLRADTAPLAALAAVAAITALAPAS